MYVCIIRIKCVICIYYIFITMCKTQTLESWKKPTKIAKLSE